MGEVRYTVPSSNPKWGGSYWLVKDLRVVITANTNITVYSTHEFNAHNKHTHAGTFVADYDHHLQEWVNGNWQDVDTDEIDDDFNLDSGEQYDHNDFANKGARYASVRFCGTTQGVSGRRYRLTAYTDLRPPAQYGDAAGRQEDEVTFRLD